jgi:hypothetical protein
MPEIALALGGGPSILAIRLVGSGDCDCRVASANGHPDNLERQAKLVLKSLCAIAEGAAIQTGAGER